MTEPVRREPALALAELLTGSPEAKILLGKTKPARGFRESAETLGRPGGGSVGGEEAPRPPVPPSRAPPELMELGETEVIGGLDPDHRELGDIEAYLDDGGGHQNRGPPVAKGLDHRELLGG